jgi:hypothetical protein
VELDQSTVIFKKGGGFINQKQKDLYNLLQYTVFYGLSGIQPGF